MKVFPCDFLSFNVLESGGPLIEDNKEGFDVKF